MAKPKKDRARNIRTFKRIEPEKRRNPASLRRLIFDLVYKTFGRSTTRAATELSATLRAHKGKRAFRRGYGGESLYKVTLDVQTVSYAQLDSIAVHYEMPLGLVLLFTRIRSELEMVHERRTSEATRVIAAARTALDALDNIVGNVTTSPSGAADVLGQDCFDAFREAYVQKYNETLF